MLHGSLTHICQCLWEPGAHCLFHFLSLTYNEACLVFLVDWDVERYANLNNILLSPLYSKLYLIAVCCSSIDYRDQKGTHHIPPLKQ